MRRGLAVLLAGWLVVALLAVPGIGLGQTTQPKPPAGAAPPAIDAPKGDAAKSVQGQIKSMAGNRVTLEDGTTLMLSDGARVNRAELRPGVTIKASFEDRGGQKVATSVEVMKQ